MKHLGTVLLVESNPGIHSSGSLALSTATQLGIRTIVITQSKAYYQTAQDNPLDYADEVVEYDTSDIPNLVQFVRTHYQNREISAVTSFSELYLVHAAILAQNLGVTGPDLNATRNARDKYLTRTQLRRSGLPVPWFYPVSSRQELEEIEPALNFPCVIKPRDGSASIGVKFCSSYAELVHAFDEVRRIDTYGRQWKPMGGMIIEEYLDGPLFSIEAFGLDEEIVVVGITDRKLQGFPYFVETQATFPVHLPYEDTLIDATKDGLKAIGLSRGPSHTEIIHTCAGDKIVEINARLGGGLVPQLIESALGINMIEETLKFLVGLQPDLAARHRRYATANHFGIQARGRLLAIHGADEAMKDPSVRKFSLAKSPGQFVDSMKSNRDVIGEFLVVADSESKARERSVETLDRIRISVEIQVTV